MADDIENDVQEPEGIEAWLTAPEAQSACGLSASQLTRAAQENVIRRVKRQRPGDQRPVYVYDPASIEDARANGQLPPAANTASEGMLIGGAVTLSKLTELVQAQSKTLIDGIKAITAASEAQAKASTSMLDAMLKQFERLDARNATNEQVVLDYIRMRNDLANDQAESDLEVAKFEHSSKLKELALEKLIEHAGPILELVKMVTKKDEESDAKTPAETPNVNPPKPTADSGSSVIDTEGTEC